MAPLDRCVEEFRAFLHTLPRRDASNYSVIDDGSRDGILQFTLSDR